MSTDLYREIILDRFRDPHYRGRITEATIEVSEDNPLCGDSLQFWLRVVEETIEEVGWNGQGCAISQVAADMLSQKIKGMSVNAVLGLTKEDVLDMLGIDPGPARLKCALLGLSTVHKGLHNRSKK